MFIRVFLISNFLVLLRGLSVLIESQSQRFCLVGSADTYTGANQAVVDANADVVILDIDSYPDQVVSLVSALCANSHAKILLMTSLSDEELQDQAIIAGARGLVDRSINPELLLTAIEKVNEGQVWLSKVATSRIFVDLLRKNGNAQNDITSSKVSLLTEREQKIVTFIAYNSGKSGKAIASSLCISESTLRNHLTSIYHKLGVVNRHGLIAFAFQNGLVEPLSPR